MTNCWCISFGVERLVMVKNNIPDIRHFYYDNFLLEHISENKIKQEIYFDSELDKNKKIKKLLEDRETIHEMKIDDQKILIFYNNKKN